MPKQDPETAQVFTRIIWIVDKSGSMGHLKGDTIGGFNQVLEEQQALPGDTLTTVVFFDTTYTVVCENVPIGEVPRLTDESYHPGGYTSLLDAIGKALVSADEHQIKLKAQKKRAPKKTVVVIQTDGEENSSREYSLTAVKALIEEKQGEGWEFLFHGVGIDLFAEAGRLGIDLAGVANFAGDAGGLRDSYGSKSRSMTSIRTGGSIRDSSSSGS